MSLSQKLSNAIGAGRLTEIKDLLLAGANPNKELHNAIWRNDVAVVRMLLDHRADPNIRDKKGWTPLHLAVWSSEVKDADVMTLLLIKAGANVNEIDNNGNTPLRIAISLSRRHSPRAKCIEILVAHGANTQCCDNLELSHKFKKAIFQGKELYSHKTRFPDSNLYDIIWNECNIEVSSSTEITASKKPRYNNNIWMAIECGDNEWLVDILKSSPQDINVEAGHGYYPLCNVINIGNKEWAKKMTQTLLQYGADFTLRQSNGRTALYYAAKTANYDLVETFLNDCSAVFSPKERDMAFQEAVVKLALVRNNSQEDRDNYIQIISLLIERGADISIKSKTGILLEDYMTTLNSGMKELIYEAVSKAKQKRENALQTLAGACLSKINIFQRQGVLRKLPYAVIGLNGEIGGYLSLFRIKIEPHAPKTPRVTYGEGYSSFFSTMVMKKKSPSELNKKSEESNNSSVEATATQQRDFDYEKALRGYSRPI